jgi:hypothetical protein
LKGEIVSVEQYPSLERVYYEATLYREDVYYEFAQYLFMKSARANNWTDYFQQQEKREQ